MVGHRPTDWHVLDLDKDPTPGDPQRVRTLAKHLHDFADDVSDALRLVKGMAGEGTLLEWAGKSADVFKEDFADVPKNLKKLKKSYEMCGDALADFWPKLERAAVPGGQGPAQGPGGPRQPLLRPVPSHLSGLVGDTGRQGGGQVQGRPDRQQRRRQAR
ncbi:WXG100 family type VII secretion target [Streptomyces qaidamensis]|uniref:WXG100 family type VII secretion target n=1 Tax=Streptomyces qaidamensis TaxID=1783515 RepID=UPI000AB1CA7B|nr:WXG100 family type VII secretion target [Streptomyces qaidamensis]